MIKSRKEGEDEIWSLFKKKMKGLEIFLEMSKTKLIAWNENF